MITINRTALVVMPAESFLDGLLRTDPTSNELSLKDLRREPAVYLGRLAVPDFSFWTLRPEAQAVVTAR